MAGVRSGLQAAAIAVAQAAGARLVVMDNVYMYGRADGRPFTEDRGSTPTPARAASAPKWPASSWPHTSPVGCGSPSVSYTHLTLPTILLV